MLEPSGVADRRGHGFAVGVEQVADDDSQTPEEFAAANIWMRPKELATA